MPPPRYFAISSQPRGVSSDLRPEGSVLRYFRDDGDPLFVFRDTFVLTQQDGLAYARRPVSLVAEP